MKAFTLLELVIVLIIIGVLALVAISLLGQLSEKGRKAEVEEVIAAVRTAEKAHLHATGNFTSDMADLRTYMQPPPESCVPSNWFKFALGSLCPSGLSAPCFSLTATRCTKGEGGKEPGADRSYDIYFAEDKDGRQSRIKPGPKPKPCRGLCRRRPPLR